MATHLVAVSTDELFAPFTLLHMILSMHFCAADETLKEILLTILA